MKLTTKREVEIAREAFTHGSTYDMVGSLRDYLDSRERARKAATRYYSLPTVERPRVVTIQDRGYSVKNGVVLVHLSNGRVVESQDFNGTLAAAARCTNPEDVAKIADLLQNPTETVEVSE